MYEKAAKATEEIIKRRETIRVQKFFINRPKILIGELASFSTNDTQGPINDDSFGNLSKSEAAAGFTEVMQYNNVDLSDYL